MDRYHAICMGEVRRLEASEGLLFLQLLDIRLLYPVPRGAHGNDLGHEYFRGMFRWVTTKLCCTFTTSTCKWLTNASMSIHVN
jgi:hypothetical protein